MANIPFELERLRMMLKARGHDAQTVEVLVNKAQQEIEIEMRDKMDAAMGQAISSGVQKKSPEFINQLQPSPGAFQLETSSSNTDFSTPPFPMLDRLLVGAKPMKDGSGVYKVIPVGASKNKGTIANNIFDAQKQIATERYETAAAQYNKIKPGASKANFRTATSKQSRNESWVIPAKDMDFTQDLSDINKGLEDDSAELIERVIKSYTEGF